MSEKLGRNMLCSCGSGKKYKRCCMGKKEPAKRRTDDDEVLTTSTGDLFMPIRFYYNIYDKDLLFSDLKKLHCIDSGKDWFNICYNNEAISVVLKKSKKAPEKFKDIVLATAKLTNDSTLHVDLKAFSRALEIIKFMSPCGMGITPSPLGEHFSII